MGCGASESDVSENHLCGEIMIYKPNKNFTDYDQD